MDRGEVNALDILLDVVFIRTFEMGCEGAATATLVSYVLIYAAMLLIWHFGKISMNLARTDRARGAA